MSQYGPYSGQPQDPWPDRQPPEEYTEPADPWSGVPYDPSHGFDYSHSAPPTSPGYDPAYGGGPAPGYEQPQPAWSPPPAPVRKTSTPLLVVIGLLAVVVVGGLAVGGYFVLKNDQAPVSQPQPPATASPTASTGGAGASTDARYAAKGQCLVNRGTKENPTMQITKCAAGTYEVLARFEGTKDYKGKCGGGKVPGYEFYYFFDSEVDSLDFVLCLKER
jgi:hypothetical protein